MQFALVCTRVNGRAKIRTGVCVTRTHVFLTNRPGCAVGGDHSSSPSFKPGFFFWMQCSASLSNDETEQQRGPYDTLSLSL